MIFDKTIDTKLTHSFLAGRAAACISLFAASSLLAGCATGGTFNAVKTPPVTAVAKPQGIVMGGQQPVVGIAIQLYAVGTTGYGSAATPLLVPGATTTNSSGQFSYSSFTCPTPTSLVYVVGIGGQPIAAVGATPAVTNNNLALMATLGQCQTVATSFVNVNELTTVAAVWALSPFMTGYANIGSSSTNSQGMANAFATVGELVNQGNGGFTSTTLPSGATAPTTQINTLADILEQCVNSGGGSASDTTDGMTNGTGCGKLFYNAKSGSTAPTDTVTAAMNIAQNPGQNVSKLNLLRSSSPVYQPVLSVNSPPTDWTIAINYTGGGLSTPTGLALDASGQVWVANSGNSTLTFLAPGSGPQSLTRSGLVSPTSIAVDQNSNVWATNGGGSNSVFVLNTKTDPGSTTLTNASLGSTVFNSPNSVAIDGTGNVWVANGGTFGLTALSYVSGTNTTAVMSGSPFTGGGISSPVSIAVSPK